MFLCFKKSCCNGRYNPYITFCVTWEAYIRDKYLFNYKKLNINVRGYRKYLYYR